MTVSGFTARSRALVAGLALMLAAAACGGSGSGGSTASGETTTAVTTVPTEPTGPEPPRPTTSGASVALPTLPIGGAAEDDSVLRQCVGVSWTGSQIIEGATVTVTRVAFADPRIFTLDRGRSCGSPDCAASFSFTPSHTACRLAVLATGANGERTEVALGGVARCTSAQQDWCANLAKVEGSPISLEQPSSPPPASPGTSTTPTTPTTPSS